jgi:hypothetical protein
MRGFGRRALVAVEVDAAEEDDGLRERDGQRIFGGHGGSAMQTTGLSDTSKNKMLMTFCSTRTRPEAEGS